MLITYFGPGSPLDQAFFNSITRDVELEAVALSATRVVVRNPSTGVVTTIDGSGLPATAEEFDSPNPAGVITGWQSTLPNGATLASVQNISWSALGLVQALVALYENDDPAPILALLGSQPITLNGAGATGGIGGIDFTGVMSNITIHTSPGPDTIRSGSGNDAIHIAANAGSLGDTVHAGPGNDQYFFPAGSDVNSWVDMVYDGLPGPITVRIDGNAGTASVTKTGQGTDTLTGIRDAVSWNTQYFAIWGTAGNDGFVIDAGPASDLRIAGGEGVDSYDLTLEGNLRLSLHGSWSRGATRGNVVDLAAGQILDDGFGNAETLRLTQAGGRFELETSNHNDSIRGSDADESFILRGGNDTLDGGGGFDRLRFDRPQMTSGVDGDLTTGRFTGSWQGTDFVKTISNIEQIRGSGFGDRLVGLDAAESFDGMGGDDVLYGNGGDDTLYGGGGDDQLYGGAGNDQLYGGYRDQFDGDDVIHVGSSALGGGDRVYGSRGSDTIVYSGVGEAGGGWNALIYEDLSDAVAVRIDGPGNTGEVGKSSGTDTLVDVYRAMRYNQGLLVYGTAGHDTFIVDGGADTWMQIAGGPGSDYYDITTSGHVRLHFGTTWYGQLAEQALEIDVATGEIANDGFGQAETLLRGGEGGGLEIYGTRQADRMTGSAGRETFFSNGGNDTIDGREGWDVLRYDQAWMNGGVSVDLIAGRATGIAHGIAFAQRIAGIEEVRGTGFEDVLRGTAADEMLRGMAGNDRLLGEGGNDTLYGGDGADTLNGGAGDDFLYGGDTDADLRDVIYGGDGNDWADGGAGNDELNGGAGHDTLIGGLGSDTLIGNEGDDILHGGGGGDVIHGGPGDDWINGGFGYDRLNGGAGADTFFHQGVADHGSDWIQDYRVAEGDVLAVGIPGAVRSQFQVNFANTPGAGAADVAEAFVIHRPTQQILFALVDGAGQDGIVLRLGGQDFDLLA